MYATLLSSSSSQTSCFLTLHVVDDVLVCNDGDAAAAGSLGAREYLMEAARRPGHDSGINYSLT